MISERTLKKWRKEALEYMDKEQFFVDQTNKDQCEELLKRILKMTQELLDKYLVRKK